ncbi:MAG TPA: AAA family ATPase, partial [Spirochaetia bacterium]
MEKKSFFLFGPRSTGKTTLLRSQFSETAIINLLASSTYLPLAADPSRIRDIVRERSKADEKIVIIDEIQKLPALLDEVHDLIETTGMRFVLTGSSARKLRRGGVNLLAGRAWQANLFPLVSAEIDGFDLARYLRVGGLPQVYGSDSPEEELDAYVTTYLREEIQAEALVQNLPQFSRFLKTASLGNAEQINFANVANDAGIPASTVRSYFQILSDTFTGFLVESWQDSRKRKAVATAKFYLFDTGVANALRGSTQLNEGAVEFGKAFEQFIA